jgi:ribonuclease HI
MIKINVNTSFCGENMSGAIGAIARDDHGDFIAATSWFIPHVVSVDMAEIMAIRNGFYLAAKIGCRSLIIESDSSNGVEALH